MSNALKILIVLLVIILLAVGSWYFFSQKAGFKPQESLLEQIQKQEQVQGFPQKINLMSGKITAIEKNKLIIEANLPSENADSLQTPTTRTIIIGEKTKLQKMISLPKSKKDNQTIYATTMVKIQLEEIKVGDLIEIFSPEDIKYQEEIIPQEITLLSSK